MHITDTLRGGLGLAFDAVEGVTDIVEGMHHNIAVRPGSFAKRPRRRASGIAGLVYACVRAVNGALRGSVDASFALAQVASPRHRGEPSYEPWVAALNGVLGDHLERTGNPFAIPMRFRIDGRALELSRDGIRAATRVASPRILILIHGLCMSDLQWTRARDKQTSHNHGHALAAAFGYTPVWLHYNSGRHVSTNGREFSELVERLIGAWPTPVHSITLLGHSMGGLVIRSALHVASEARAAWFSKVDRAVYLGTPHHGAVLERAGNRLQAGVAWSRYSAPFAELGAIRSAGITDLRHGNVLDADWRGVDRFDCHNDRRRRAPLTAGPGHYAIAATLSPQPGTAGRGPGAVIGRLLGDGLVHPSSATGRHRDPERTLAFAYDHVRTFHGLGHLELLSSAEVYAQLTSWLGTQSS